MDASKIIVIGTSAGGVESLIDLFKNVSKDVSAPIFIVRHFPVASISHLRKILQKVSQMHFEIPENQMPIEENTVYIAPTNRHMLLRPGQIELVFGPRINGVRPAVDPLFRSAAQSYGSRVIGVILSGTMDDGMAGMIAIKKAGGINIVQDPEEAAFPGMPLSAIRQDHVDYILPVAEIAQKLLKLTKQVETDKVGPDRNVKNPGNPEMKKEPGEMEEPAEFIISQEMKAFAAGQRMDSARTVITCPECGGVIWEVKTAEMPRYVCHVGHAYSVESMLSSQDLVLESLLWETVRALKERFEFRQRAALHADAENHPELSQSLMEDARKSIASAELVQKELVSLFS